MTVVRCAGCGARNRADALECLDCGRKLPFFDSPAAVHARDWVEREKRGGFFADHQEALDFSPASLKQLDELITEMWGKSGEAPGDAGWQPTPAKIKVILDFGAYLGETLCRSLPGRWQMDPARPQAIVAARVVDAKGRRINPFAQLVARFRDGADAGLTSLWRALRVSAVPASTVVEQPATEPPVSGRFIVPAATPPASGRFNVPAATSPVSGRFNVPAPVAAASEPAVPSPPSAPAAPASALYQPQPPATAVPPTPAPTPVQVLPGAAFAAAYARIDPVALLRDADQHAARGDLPTAVARYRQLLDLEPLHHDARRQLAIALAQGGDLTSALRELDELKRQRPKDIGPAQTRAELLAQAGRFDEALGTLEMALLHHPGEPVLLRRRGLVRLQAGQAARAQIDLEQAMAGLPDDPELLLGLAHSLEQQGQTRAAIHRLEVLLSLPAVKRSATQDADARARLKSLQQAAASGIEPVAAAPAPATAAPAPPSAERASESFARGSQLAQARRFSEALPLLIEGSHTEPELGARLCEVGQCLLELGRPLEARDWLLRCLPLGNGEGRVRCLLGQIEEQLGQRAGAIERYREVLNDPMADELYVDQAYDRLKALGALA